MNKVKFSSIAKFVAGQSPESKYYSSNPEDGVPFMQGNRTFGMIYPTIDTYTSKVTKLAKKGDILMSVRAPVGDLNFAPCDLCIGRGLSSITAKDGNNDFLFYALKYNIANLIKKGSGTTFDSVGRDVVEKMEMIIPKDEYIRDNIAELLKSIDLKIENNNKINCELENVSNLLYDYWFLQFNFPNESGKPYKESGGKMEWNISLKKDVPVGWYNTTLKSVVSKDRFSIVDGPFGTQLKVSEYKEHGIPVYEMEQLNGEFIVRGSKHFVSEEKFNQIRRSSVKNGDIIISKTGTLGLLGIVRSKYEKGIIVSRLAKITPDPEVIGKYALKILLQKYTNAGYWRKKSGGSTMPILNNTIIEDVPILMPDTSLYKLFESKVEPLYDKIYNNQIQNEYLMMLRDWLLPLLMNGQVTIHE